jgi:hypothetical protein
MSLFVRIAVDDVLAMLADGMNQAAIIHNVWQGGMKLLFDANLDNISGPRDDSR